MATLSITVPDPQVPRIQAAIGIYLSLGRDATASEVQEVLVDTLTTIVRKTEVGVARDDADEGFQDPGITP